MAVLWQNQGLKGINIFLSDIEMKKELEEKRRIVENRRLNMLADEMVLNPKGFNKLSESNIWCRTEHEDNALIQFKQAMENYQPRRTVQKKVLSFAISNDVARYIKLDFPLNAVDEYIDKSNYWKKNSVKIKPKGSNEYIKIVYAYNNQMESIIFEYLKKMVVTTLSSFENHLKAIEGKPLRHECVISGKALYSTGEEIRTRPEKKTIDQTLDLLAKFNKKVKEYV